MRFGAYVPNYGRFGSSRDLVEMGCAAERAGWDGFFLYDTLVTAEPAADPQVVLAALAVTTSSITLGALVTPLARRRPAKVARELASLSTLAEREIVLGVGLGLDSEFEPFSAEPLPLRQRAATVADHLDLLKLFLGGVPVDWRQSAQSMQAGGHLSPGTVRTPPFLPTPPYPVSIWGAATVQRSRQASHPTGPFRRAKALGGLFPISSDAPQHLSLSQLEYAVELTFGADPLPAGFDLVVEGSGGASESPDFTSYAELGVTWWLEALPHDTDPAAALDLIRRGPPPSPHRRAKRTATDVGPRLGGSGSSQQSRR